MGITTQSLKSTMTKKSKKEGKGNEPNSVIHSYSDLRNNNYLDQE